jgi:hypothetical protein
MFAGISPSGSLLGFDPFDHPSADFHHAAGNIHDSTRYFKRTGADYNGGAHNGDSQDRGHPENWDRGGRGCSG